MDTRVYQAPQIYRKKEKKKRTFKKLWLIPIILVCIYFTLFLLVVPERLDKPVLMGDDRPLVIAHRGGSELAPENTLIAFDKANDLGVDMIEFDVHMTNDGHLVVIHDETVDRTTNGEGNVHELTLAQIKELNAAHYFRDIRGNYIYRGAGVTVPTVEEVFQQFPNMRFNIEMKVIDLPAEEDLSEAEQRYVQQETMEKKLWDIIHEYEMEEQVLVASYSDDIMETFREHAQGVVATTASYGDAQRFLFYHKLFLERIYRPQADVLQVPPEYGVINLKDERLVSGAHRLNMHIHYLTINDEQSMRNILTMGADGILTDRPDLLIRVMNEMEAFQGTN